MLAIDLSNMSNGETGWPELSVPPPDLGGTSRGAVMLATEPGFACCCVLKITAIFFKKKSSQNALQTYLAMV